MHFGAIVSESIKTQRATGAIQSSHRSSKETWRRDANRRKLAEDVDCVARSTARGRNKHRADVVLVDYSINVRRSDKKTNAAESARAALRLWSVVQRAVARGHQQHDGVCALP
ncbi:hypothetical protein LSAT2_017010 [Lamellibrachia satsuma]|nr:hypothetical protein LSAT2_017010 [Lamellibrachia satsuma]